MNNKINVSTTPQIKSLFGEIMNSDVPVRLVVSGTSMTPILRPQDVVYISKIRLDQLTNGDLVAIVINGVVTHRYIKSIHGKILTRGDACYWFDKPADPGAILGVVKKISRNGKTIDLSDQRWQLINKIIGTLGRIQFHLVGTKPSGLLISNIFHKIQFWLGKIIVWFILSILAYEWVYRS